MRARTWLGFKESKKHYLASISGDLCLIWPPLSNRVFFSFSLSFFFFKHHVVCCWLNQNNGPQWWATRAKRLMFYLWYHHIFFISVFNKLISKNPDCRGHYLRFSCEYKNILLLEAVGEKKKQKTEKEMWLSVLRAKCSARAKWTLKTHNLHAIISITWQQHWQKLRILISNMHIFLPLQCQHNPWQEWVLHRTARKAEG